MMKTIQILSTKKLTSSQTTVFNHSNISLTAVDFIDTMSVDFDKSALRIGPKNWVITSKNAVEVIFNHFDIDFLSTINFFTVGDKTTKLLAGKKLNVIASALSSKSLGEKIISSHSSNEFSLIVGNYRRAELPELFIEKQIQFTEFTVYQTVLTPQKVGQKYDGILFFSPSGIESYLKENELTTEQLFCIGQTTAKAARQFSQNINIAKAQTFESVLELTKQFYA